MSDVIGYRLTPVRMAQPGELSTAAACICLATGEILSGSGGGGEFLSLRVVEALRNDGTGRTVLRTDDYEALMALVATLGRDDADMDDHEAAARIHARLRDEEG